MSHRSFRYLLVLSLFAASAATSLAQNAGAAFTQEPAPIERNASPQNAPFEGAPHRPNRYAHAPRIHTAQPAHGVSVRSDAPLQTVASDAQHVELKLDHGRANVMVHDPAEDQLVLVDLPGGQTQLLKNGFYTFNADTNTVRVFSGEADAFAGTQDKPARVKGDNQAVFAGGDAKVSYSDPYYSRQDVIPGPNGNYEGPRESTTPVYGYAPVPYGYYDEPYGYYGGWASPYDAWGSPYYGYGWGYPYYGWGGIGFGWGGGYRGGYYGGYPGRGGIGRGGGSPIHPGGSYGGGSHGAPSGGFHGGSAGSGSHGGGGGHR